MSGIFLHFLIFGTLVLGFEFSKLMNFEPLIAVTWHTKAIVLEFGLFGWNREGNPLVTVA